MSEQSSIWDEFFELNKMFKDKKKQSTRIADQSQWEESEHLKYRSASIDKILSNYTKQQEQRYTFKKRWKSFFVIFFIALSMLIFGGAVAVCVVGFLYFSDKKTEFLTCIITAAVSCLTSIVTILLIIVKYIFPPDEETNFNNLVSIIVENDTMRLKDISNTDKNNQTK